MQAEQDEPRGVTQIDNILCIRDELLGWANCICSNSVRRDQRLGTGTSRSHPFPRLQAHQSWEAAGREKEYSDKVQYDNRLSSNSSLTQFKLQLAERNLVDVVVRLRSAINFTHSINKLPPEILAQCFLYLTPCFSPTLEFNESGYDWIRVTHVCKHWRAVAFNFPQLWDRIEFTRPEILDTYLKPSAYRPLEICLQPIGRGSHRVMQHGDVIFALLAPAIPRIQSLIIDIVWIPPHNRCQLLQGPLPELETLSITSGVGWEKTGAYVDKIELEALFQNGLPRLRQLFIAECIPWPSNDFKNLTCLCLYNQPDLEDQLTDLLQMLRRSPNIEELYIRQREESHRITTHPSNPGPTFPTCSLRKLHLRNFGNVAIASIFSTMLLQPNGVAVHISDATMDADTFDQIFPSLPPEFTLGSAKKLEVYHDLCVHLGIMFCAVGGSLRICGHPAPGHRMLFRYIYRECARSLEELWIHNGNVGENFIFDGFSCFNLVNLVVVGRVNVTGRLCETLHPRTLEIRDLPAPRLRSLTIPYITDRSRLQWLIALCEARSRTGNPLQEVSIACGSRKVPEWMTRLCSSSPTPIRMETRNERGGRMMELPIVCKDSTGPWWPSWTVWGKKDR